MAPRPASAALALALVLGSLAGGAFAARVDRATLQLEPAEVDNAALKEDDAAPLALAASQGAQTDEVEMAAAPPGALAEAGAQTNEVEMADAGAQTDEDEGALLEAAASLEKVVNEPSKYASYIKPISQAIVSDDQTNVLEVFDHDASDNLARTGRIIFHVIGTCPSSVMCGDQAVTFANFDGQAVAYWSKPHPELLECTRSRHVKGKCKNDSDKFRTMEKLFSGTGGGGGSYFVDSTTDRAVVMKDNEKLYIYAVYASNWSTWSGTMDGWLLYQKDPKAQEFFRIQFKSGKDAKFNFKGEGQKMTSFWPTKAEVDV